MSSDSHHAARPSSGSQQYDRVLSTLLQHEHVFYSPVTSPHKLLVPQNASSPSPTISSLAIHPVLESVLHLLNCDLPSAHFLCRKAEIAPAFESMYAHGILHRIEGDVDNARAWYGDVKGKDVFAHVWSARQVNGAGKEVSVPDIAQQGWRHYLDRVERWRDRPKGRRSQRQGDVLDVKDIKDWDAEEKLLRETSLWEIKRLLEYCERKFTTSKVDDASSEFKSRMQSGNEELVEQATSMVTGGEGWRQF